MARPSNRTLPLRVFVVWLQLIVRVGIAARHRFCRIVWQGNRHRGENRESRSRGLFGIFLSGEGIPEDDLSTFWVHNGLANFCGLHGHGTVLAQ